MHAGILGIQLLWAGFLSRRMVLLGRIHTLAIRKSIVGFLGRWKIIRQFLLKFNIESSGWEAGIGYGELYSISEDGVRLWSIPVYVGEGC